MIKDRLKVLEKLGYMVFNFEQGKRITRGSYTGWVDFVIVGHGTVYFLERKRKYEKLSDEQRELAKKLKECEVESVSGVRNLVYDVISEENVEFIIKMLIKGAER